MMISNKYNISFIKTSTFLLIATTVANICAYLFQIVTARYLSVESYGILNTALSFNFLFAITALPLQNFVANEISKLKARNELCSGFFRFTVHSLLPNILLLTFVPATFAVILGRRVHISYINIFITIVYFSLTNIQMWIVGMFQGLQRFKILAIVIMLFPMSVLFFGAGAAMLGHSETGVLFGRLLAGILTISFFYVLLYRIFMHDKTVYVADKIGIFKYFVLTGSAYIFYNTLMQADILLVRLFFSSYETGIYSSAAIFGKAIIYFPAAIALVIFPLVAENTAAGDTSEKLLLKAILLNVVLSILGAFFLLLFSKFIVLISLGNAYVNATQLVRFYGFAFVPLSIINIFFTYFLAKEKYICILPLGIAVLIEIIGTCLFHASFIQVMVNIFFASFIGNIIFIVLLYDEYRKCKIKQIGAMN
ncbi:oligosaccharide flippase family protein [Treponema lecithinolyticum]|uniref:Polysaccharide biosynthesis protein n=1 Tax=Treponema lecithinolyticum ATCC 700332 TaxID=1321815 RepID=A0ABN0NZU4_TRELE|nr:oligosaccharide flippase family protein [Treponema lecithinolyticum]ERJ93609.1 polysaccharide biosynthesis protein [Treponema lecithinolyticum ATCC 700332]